MAKEKPTTKPADAGQDDQAKAIAAAQERLSNHKNAPDARQDGQAKAIAAAQERLSNHKNAPDARQDGPTIEQFVAADYRPEYYPPKDFAVKESQGLIEFVTEGKISEETLGVGIKELAAMRAEREAAERAAANRPVADAKPADAGTVPPKPVDDSSVAPKPKACDHTGRCEAHRTQDAGSNKVNWTCTRKGCALENKYEPA